MNLSENLRRLRLERGMTQSALAEALGVSDRAVSRWERGESLPDVTLLPALSRLLGASVDALLGVDEARRKAAIDAALSACSDAMQHSEPDRAIAALRPALSAWPDEPELMVALARSLMALHTEDAAREALALCRAADGKPARLSTLYGCKQVMALALHRLGKAEQAAQLVSDEMPSFWVCRELLYPRVAPPDKAEGQRQFNLLWLADQMYFTLREMARACGDSALAVRLLELAIRILMEVTDGQPGLYEDRICQAWLLIAQYRAGEGASSALEEARAAAQRYARHEGRYQAAWLSMAHDSPTSADAAEALAQHVRQANM